MRHRWGDGRARPVSRPRPVCSGPGSSEGRPVVPQAEAPPGMRSPRAEGVGGQKSQRLPQCPALGGHLSAPCEEQRKRRPLCFEDDVESRVPPMTPNPRLVSQTEQGWPVTVPVGTAVGRAGRAWRESDRESELDAARAASSSPVFRRGRCRPDSAVRGVCAGPTRHPGGRVPPCALPPPPKPAGEEYGEIGVQLHQLRHLHENLNPACGRAIGSS